jgi:hypothetical protein
MAVGLGFQRKADNCARVIFNKSRSGQPDQTSQLPKRSLKISCRSIASFTPKPKALMTKEE